jgi:hypothetical protein
VTIGFSKVDVIGVIDDSGLGGVVELES